MLPLFEELEPRVLLDAAPILSQGLGTSDPTYARDVVYVTVPSVKSGTTFVSGGVYRSIDGALTWQWAMGAGINKTIGQQAYGESDTDQFWFLGQDEGLPDTVYVTDRGTGYWPPYAYTVYRSDDAGANWLFTFFNDERDAPDGHNYNNTELGWIFYVANRGFGGSALGFAVNPGDAGEVLYTNGAEVFITRDSGATWHQAYSQYAPGQSAPTTANPGRWSTTGLDVTSSWYYDFDPSDPNRTYMSVTDIGFWRSTDRGASWYSADQTINWNNTIYQIALDPAVPGKIWAACSNQHDIPHWTQLSGPTGSGGVAISTNYGATWTSVTSGGLPSAPVTGIVLDPTSPVGSRTLYASVYGSGVYKSTDGGTTWTSKSTGLTPTSNLQISNLKRTADGTLYCSMAPRYGSPNTSGAIFKSVNGGNSWTQISSSAIYYPRDFAVDPTNANIIYVAASDGFGHSGGVSKTTNGGTSWTLIRPAGVTGSLEGFGVFLNPQDHNVLYFTTITHGMFISYDAGATWSACGPGNSPPFQSPQRITWDPLDPGTVYVTTFGGGVWRGADPAYPNRSPQRWVSIGPGGGGGIFAPSASPCDPDVLFVSCDMGAMYRSDDGGASWDMLDWRNIRQSAAPVFHPTDPNIVYALPFEGSGDTLRISLDAGLTWPVVGGATPVWDNDNLLALDIDPDNPLLMLLAGQGALYRTTNGGTTWAKVSGAPTGLIGFHFDRRSPSGARVVVAANATTTYRSANGGLTWAASASGLPSSGAGVRAISGGTDFLPVITGASVNGGDAQRSTITSIAITFSEDVSASLALGDLALFNLTTQTAASLAGATFSYDAATNTATWNLAGTALADGRYRATLSGSGVTDATGRFLDGNGDGTGGDDYALALHRLLCDATGDAKVDGADLAVWQQNYDPRGTNPLNGPGTGDWTGDGRIDGGDLALWQQNYDPSALAAAAEPIPQLLEASPTGAFGEIVPAAGDDLATEAGDTPAGTGLLQLDGPGSLPAVLIVQLDIDLGAVAVDPDVLDGHGEFGGLGLHVADEPVAVLVQHSLEPPQLGARETSLHPVDVGALHAGYPASHDALGRVRPSGPQERRGEEQQRNDSGDRTPDDDAAIPSSPVLGEERRLDVGVGLSGRRYDERLPALEALNRSSGRLRRHGDPRIALGTDHDLLGHRPDPSEDLPPPFAFL